MTSKERILTVFRNEQPDRVPVTPDMSNMIPCKLTGKPFWDIYLYQNPPIWKAYIDAVRYFGFDGFLDDWKFRFEDDPEPPEEFIIEQTPERIITTYFEEKKGKKVLSRKVNIYPSDNSMIGDVPASKIGITEIPKTYLPVEGKKKWPKGQKLLSMVLDYMGDDGVVGIGCGNTLIVENPEEIYEYYDSPEKTKERALKNEEDTFNLFNKIINLDRKPDFLACGSSGTLIWQTLKMVKELALPMLKKLTRLAREAGIPTQVHSCGPEKELVKLYANETDLDLIDPLEIPPMGDCILKELKELYGHKIALKGNLHTTDVMLRGSSKDVEKASRKAIDDTKAEGGFILSTGDQCGRDTPEENIFKMIEVAETYGRY